MRPGDSPPYLPNNPNTVPVQQMQRSALLLHIPTTQASSLDPGPDAGAPPPEDASRTGHTTPRAVAPNAISAKGPPHHLRNGPQAPPRIRPPPQRPLPARPPERQHGRPRHTPNSNLARSSTPWGEAAPLHPAPAPYPGELGDSCRPATCATSVLLLKPTENAVLHGHTRGGGQMPVSACDSTRPSPAVQKLRAAASWPRQDRHPHQRPC